MIIGILGIVALLVLIFLGMPIATTLFLIGFCGCWALNGITVANNILHFSPITAIVSGDTVAVPLFILIGCFALTSGVATDGFNVARKWLGKLPGGLGVTTVAASAFFAACSGSSLASAVTMGKLTIPEMESNDYDPALMTGVIGAGGLLATMIPPSATMVLYGLASGESIASLLIAGTIPGVILAVAFAVTVIMVAKINPKKAPLIKDNVTWKERFRVLPQAWGVAAIFITIFIGVFTGLFTATESAAFGSLIALSLIIIKGRKSGDTWQRIKQSCREGSEITVRIYFIVLASYVFSRFLILAGLPTAIQNTVSTLNVAPIWVVIIMLASFLVLGMFLDSVTILLVAIPIYYPVVTALGYDGIWFGVIVVAMIEIGLLTPPFGMVAYGISSICPKISIVTIFRGCILFVVIEAVVVALIVAFPNMAMWLPNLMK